MSYRRVVVAVIVTLTVLARVAAAQTPATTVGVGQFFRTLYSPATRDAQANGGRVVPTPSWRRGRTWSWRTRRVSAIR
jgi:hypothetical protein